MRKLVKELAAESAFDPEALTIMATAFDRAWLSLRASGAPFAAGDHAERAREILGKSIIEAAKNGERDPQQLCDGALLYLARSKLKKPRRPPDRTAGATMSGVELSQKAKECAQALAAAGDPSQREALFILGQLWMTLANERQFLRDDDLAAEIAEIARIHADLMKPGAD
jgi:hypothetical protein